MVTITDDKPLSFRKLKVCCPLYVVAMLALILLPSRANAEIIHTLEAQGVENTLEIIPAMEGKDILIDRDGLHCDVFGDMVHLPLSFLRRIRYGVADIETSVAKCEAETPAEVTLSEDVIHILCTHPTEIELYDDSGRCLMTDTLEEGGSLSIDNLAEGVYILCVGQSTYKLKI